MGVSAVLAGRELPAGLVQVVLRHLLLFLVISLATNLATFFQWKSVPRKHRRAENTSKTNRVNFLNLNSSRNEFGSTFMIRKAVLAPWRLYCWLRCPAFEDLDLYFWHFGRWLVLLEPLMGFHFEVWGQTAFLKTMLESRIWMSLFFWVVSSCGYYFCF